MVREAEIREFVDKVVAEFAPQRVILFGSHARGDATPDSDVDLLVIMPTKKRDGSNRPWKSGQALEHHFATGSAGADAAGRQRAARVARLFPGNDYDGRQSDSMNRVVAEWVEKAEGDYAIRS